MDLQNLTTSSNKHNPNIKIGTNIEILVNPIKFTRIINEIVTNQTVFKSS